MSTRDNHGLTGAAVLLAAGAGTRYDPSGRHNKLMAPIDGRPIACLAAQTLLDAGLRTVAVVRSAGGSLAATLDAMGCLVTVCGEAHQGMGISLAHGVRVARIQFDPDRILVALADMPFLQIPLVRQVIETVDADHQIAAAAVNGRRGHPVAFWHEHFDALTQLTGDRGAASLISNHPVTLIDSNDDAVVKDIDQPKDLPT